jgi:hypothetical protein
MSTTYTKGDYQAEILDHGFDRSQIKGTPAFFMQLRILGRFAANGKLTDCPQYERTYRQYLSTETGFRVLCGDLRTLGLEVASLDQLNLGAPDHINLVGRKITVSCAPEVFNGRQVERWRIARNRAKLDLDAIRALNQKYGHILRGGGEDEPVGDGTEATDSGPKS